MIAGILLVMVVTWLLISAYYEFAVLPVLRDRAKFKIFAIRDELRREVVSGSLEAKSVAFQHLQSMLNKMIPMCEYYSVSNVLFAILTMDRHATKSREREQFDANASEFLKNLEARAVDVMFGMLFKNSPLVCVLIGSAMLFSKAMKKSLRLANRAIWHDRDVSRISGPWQASLSGFNRVHVP